MSIGVDAGLSECVRACDDLDTLEDAVDLGRPVDERVEAAEGLVGSEVREGSASGEILELIREDSAEEEGGRAREGREGVGKWTEAARSDSGLSSSIRTKGSGTSCCWESELYSLSRSTTSWPTSCRYSSSSCLRC